MKSTCLTPYNPLLTRILGVLLCSALPLLLFASGPYPDRGIPQDNGGPCKCINGQMVCPKTSSEPVLLMRGSLKENATDLSIPGPLGGWSHSREYDSVLDTRTYNNPMYNIHGRRWAGGPQAVYLRRSGNTMELFLSASNKRTFTDNNPGQINGTYGGPVDLNVTLTKSVMLSHLVYTLTYPESGDVYIFREKDPADPCWGISGAQSNIIPLSERTNLAYLTQGLTGETYFYNGNRLALVVTADPQAYFIKYTYGVSGYTNGFLTKIEAYDGAPEVPESTKIAQVDYTYVDYANAGPAVGYPGDLAQVKVSELLSDGVSWDHKYTQYRGYNYESGGYFQLKSVYEPDAIERIMQNNAGVTTPENLLTRYDYEGLSSGNTIGSYASRTFTYYNYGVFTGGVGTAWGYENLQSKYGGNDRHEMHDAYLGFVLSETINSGCSSCGGSSTGGKKLDYYYMTLGNVPATSVNADPNVAHYLTVVDTRDSVGNPLKRTITAMNWRGIELREAVIENPNAATLNVVCTSKILDDEGKVIEERPEEAHSLITTNAQLKEFLNPYVNGSWANDLATVAPSKGIIKITEYDPVSRKKTGSLVKIGSGGTAYYISATDYNAQGQVVAEHIYPTQTTDRDAADRVTAAYAYTYWEDNFKNAIKTKTETQQAVPVSQNGTDIVAVTQTFYDMYGKVRWTRDPLGVVAYYGYHPFSMQSALVVRDVDTSALPGIITTDTDDIAAWTDAAPFSRDGGLATAFNQTTTIGYDKRGRVYVTTGPDGVASYTIRDAQKTMRFSAWDDTTQKPILPISVTEVNAAGKPTSVYELPPTAVVLTNGLPSGIDPNATKVSWTRSTYDPRNGSHQYIDRYHTIPASGVGVLGTNFYRTASVHDQQGRQIATAQYVANNKWQVNAVRFDWRDRPIENLQGVTTTMPTTLANIVTGTTYAAYLKMVGKVVYDGDHVVKQTSYFDTGTNDYTGVNYKYDNWGRLRGAESFSMTGTTEMSFGPYNVRDYDWRSNVIATAVFETAPNWSTVVTTDNFAATTTTGRRGLTKSSFDVLGNAYQTETFEVASNGVAGNSAVINFYRDTTGREVATEQANRPRSEVEYDALGRQIRAKVKVGIAVVAMTEMEFDISGHMSGQHSYELNPNETTGIAPNSNNYTRRTAYFWYDRAGRPNARADYGSGGPTWDYYAKPVRSVNAPDTSSEFCLVMHTAYSVSTGKQEISTDAAGKVDKSIHDSLGRATSRFQNYKTGNSVAAYEDVEVCFVYDGLGNMTTMTAVNQTTGNQITRYLYEDPINASLQTSTIYPDSSDTNSSGTDQIKTAYYLDGNTKQITDQNGTVRQFIYDNQRRRITDHVVTLGTSIDGGVRKITRSYTWFGAMERITSLDQVNQIKSLNRGTLNQNRTEITSSNFIETWDFDKTGNWIQYDRDGSIENRTHNAANELQGVATHDANGNMVLMPGLKGKYDAWNRLVEVRDSQDSLIAKYKYDGLDRRIEKVSNNKITITFFNENWQELESHVENEITAYVWGIRYIDDLIYRDKDDERLYSFADSNWNTVALVDQAGFVQERMQYDGFGNISWLAPNFTLQMLSSVDWNRTFTGQVYDIETGLMLYRNRYYHTGLGRFVSRDPIAYKANDVNIHRYVFNSPLTMTDALGLANMQMCETEARSIELTSDSFIPNLPNIRIGAYGDVGGGVVIELEHSYCRIQCTCDSQFVDEESASMYIAGQVSASIGFGLSFDFSTGRFRTGVSGYAGLQGTFSAAIGISGQASTDRCCGNDGEARTTCGKVVFNLEASGGARVTVHIGGVQRSLGADVFARGSVTYGICITCTPSSCTYSGPTQQDASIIAGVRFCYGRCWEYTWGVTF